MWVFFKSKTEVPWAVVPCKLFQKSTKGTHHVNEVDVRNVVAN